MVEANGVHDSDMLTIGERLEALKTTNDLTNNNYNDSIATNPVKAPNADSIAVILKQALQADDRNLILDCIFTPDEKVVANSVSILNLSEVLKFLDFLLPIVHSKRGTIAVSVLPWLRNVILQHASGIISHDSALNSLNMLYQAIDTRVSTFNTALDLAASLDSLLYVVGDDGQDDDKASIPVIYEDHDSDSESVEDMDYSSDDPDQNIS